MPLVTALRHPPLPPARQRRLGAVLGVAAAVLCLHGWLIGTLAPAWPQRLGEPADAAVRPQPLQVRRLAAVPAEPPAGRAPLPSAGSPATVPADPPGPRSDPRPAGPAMPRPPPPAAAPAPTAAPTALAIGQAIGQAPAADVAPARLPAEADLVGPDRPWAPPNPPVSPDAAPPPVYPTRIPAPVQLRYALRYNGQAGEATLTWRHDGTRYQLDLDGRSATHALVVQASQGGFDAAGLAPERFTDRRRGGHQQAANFRRDIGRIAFSGPAVDYPAWPGAQDRLSWLPQFVAIRAAAPRAIPDVSPVAAEPAPATTSLFVVDARGAGALWHVQPDGEVLLPTPLGPRTTERWRREPPSPEGLRVEVWLDASLGHWPARLRFTALRSGDVFELLLQDEPTPPAGLPP